MPLSHDRDTKGVLLLSYKVMSFCSKFTYLNFRRASGLCAGVRIYWIQTHLSAQRCCLCACSRGSLYKYSVLVHAHTYTHIRTAFALDLIPFHKICMNMYAARIYWIQALSAPLCCLFLRILLGEPVQILGIRPHSDIYWACVCACVCVFVCMCDTYQPLEPISSKNTLQQSVFRIECVQIWKRGDILERAS